MKKEQKKGEEKPRLRAVRQVTVEQVVEAEHGPLHIEGISIAGQAYKLDIHNTNEEMLSLDFNDGDYRIRIDSKGITFERYVYRPNHDHGDPQYLQVGVDDKVMGVKKGEVQWLAGFPHKDLGRDFFRIPFGSIEVGY